MIPYPWFGAEETPEDIKEQRNRYAVAIANVVVYTCGRTDLTGAEVAGLLAGKIPARLRGGAP